MRPDRITGPTVSPALLTGLIHEAPASRVRRTGPGYVLIRGEDTAAVVRPFPGLRRVPQP
jgi:hypothetical protein